MIDLPEFDLAHEMLQTIENVENKLLYGNIKGLVKVDKSKLTPGQTLEEMLGIK